ncbi:MAG: tetratricopeptide repeat protein, partial [Flavobacteriales bacterium]
YPSGLGGDLLPIATNIIEFEKVNSAKALAAAHVLFVKSTTESSDVKAWSLNVYVEFLLSNDSISKAEKLLVDSSLVNWNSVKPYLQDYKLLNQGRLFGFNGNYFAADTCFRTVMNRASNRVLSLQSIQALAQNLRFQGKLDQSSVRWYEAQKISEEISDSSSTMQAYLGLGTVWFLRDELEKARTNFELFYAYNERIGNEKGVAAALSLIGLVYYKTKDFELCIETNLEGYGIRKRIGDIKGQGESLNNLALGYMGMKNWNQGLQYLQEAVEIKTRANDLTQLTVILNNIGHCYSRLGKNELALKYFNLALAKGKENGQMRDVVNSYQNIIQLYRKSNDFSDALAYPTSLMALKDSLAKED